MFPLRALPFFSFALPFVLLLAPPFVPALIAPPVPTASQTAMATE